MGMGIMFLVGQKWSERTLEERKVGKKPRARIPVLMPSYAQSGEGRGQGYPTSQFVPKG